MNLLESTFLYDVQPTLNRLLDDEDLHLVADHSDYVVVDGEEGDFGVVRYRNGDNQLVAVRTVQGGDSETIELTPFGAQLVKQRLLAVLTQALDSTVTGNPTLA